MMSNWLVFILIWLASPMVVMRGEDQIPAKDLKIAWESGPSPDGTFKAVYRSHDPEQFLDMETEIWLDALKPEFKTQLLCKFVNRATLEISPDDSFIAVDNHVASSIGQMIVFSKGKDGLFRKADHDFLEEGLKLMQTQLKRSKPIAYDHWYCYSDHWLRDGLLLAHISGRDGEGMLVRAWYFLYDAKKNEFTWDISKINKDGVEMTERGKKQ